MTTNWTSKDFYKHEPLSVYVTNISGGYVTISNVVIDSVAFTFTSRHNTTGNSMTIDLTDFARMARTSFSLKLTDSSSNKTLTGSYAGNADPLFYVAPASPSMALIQSHLGNPKLNYPLPSMIIRGEKINVEYIYEHGEILVPTKGISDDSTFGIFVIDDDEPVVVYSVNDSPDVMIRLVPQQCDIRYWVVEWTSRTGLMKRHCWEVVKVTESTSKSQELQILDRQWDVRKNKLVSVTLRLKELDAYDIWYYSDIITSNSVKVINDAEISRIVNVTTKKVVMPDGDAGKKGTLEIDVEYYKTEGI